MNFFKKSEVKQNVTSSSSSSEVKTIVTKQTVTTKSYSSTTVKETNFETDAIGKRSGNPSDLFYSFGNNNINNGRSSFSGLSSSSRITPSYTPVYARRSFDNTYKTNPVLKDKEKPGLFSRPSSSPLSKPQNFDKKPTTFKSPVITSNSSILPPSSTKSPVNTTSALDKYDLKNKAFVVIFNQEKFTRTDIEDRKGTQKDVDRLKKLFKNYKADFQVEKDLKVKQIKDIMDKLKNKKFTSYSCVIVIVLSHGSNNDTIFAADDPYRLDDVLVEPLAANETLKGKPKVYFVQACKGNSGMEIDAVPFRTATANKSDIFKGYSTYEGHVSYRNPNEGTKFIQELCSTLEIEGSKNLTEIMMTIRKKFQNDKYAQMPPETSTFMKAFHFDDLKRK